MTDILNRPILNRPCPSFEGFRIFRSNLSRKLFSIEFYRQKFNYTSIGKESPERIVKGLLLLSSPYSVVLIIFTGKICI